MKLIRFFQRLSIVIHKGKYSLEYVNFVKQNYGIIPFNSCIKNKLPHYLLQFVNKPTLVFQSHDEIRFGEIPFGSKFKDVINSKGIPGCFNVESVDNSILKVVRFNEKIGKSVMHAVYFFLDDCFFMGEYRFNDITNLNPSEVVTVLGKQYHLEIPGTSESFFIEDQAGTAIRYSFNGINMSILYLSKNDKNINTILSNYLHREKNIEIGEDDVESILKQHF